MYMYTRRSAVLFPDHAKMLVQTAVFYRLKEIETYGLCMQIRDYLKQYVILPNHMTDSQAQNYNGVMSDICDFVRDYVQKLLTREIDYQKMIASRDALALKEFFQHYLSMIICLMCFYVKTMLYLMAV